MIRQQTTSILTSTLANWRITRPMSIAYSASGVAGREIQTATPSRASNSEIVAVPPSSYFKLMPFCDTQDETNTLRVFGWRFVESVWIPFLLYQDTTDFFSIPHPALPINYVGASTLETFPDTSITISGSTGYFPSFVTIPHRGASLIEIEMTRLVNDTSESSFRVVLGFA